jgi:hypothetical protein
MKHLQSFDSFINEGVTVDTVRFKRSHSKEPRGFGMWAFYFDKTGGEAILAPAAMDYADAVKWAKEEAKKADKKVIYVGESFTEENP